MLFLTDTGRGRNGKIRQKPQHLTRERRAVGLVTKQMKAETTRVNVHEDQASLPFVNSCWGNHFTICLNQMLMKCGVTGTRFGGAVICH